MDSAWYGIIGSLLGAIVGGTIAYFSSYNLWKKQIRMRQQNLLLAFKTEILNVKKIIEKLQLHQEGSQSSIMIKAFIIDTPCIYPQGGLYYVSNTEIFNFPEIFSQKLYEFYINLIEAEKYRSIFIGTPNSPLNNMYISSIHKSMLVVNSLIPELLKFIDNELNR